MRAAMLKKGTELKKGTDALERRRAERVEMKIPVIVYTADTQNITSLYFSENMSKDGMYILSTRDVFKPQDRVYMEFAVPLKIVSRRIRLIGRVVRKEGGEEGGYGIKFEKMFERDSCFLKSYLACLKSCN